MISASISKAIKNNDIPTGISISNHGPYINCTFDPELIVHYYNEHDIQPVPAESNGQLVLIESPSPNTNKPLHLGHVRNMVLGNVLARSLDYEGYTIKKVEVINNRGIHICKSMLAYQLWGNHEEPTKKSDHYVGDRYVRYAQEEDKDPTLKEQAQAMLRQREA